MNAHDVDQDDDDGKGAHTPFWMFYTSDWAGAVIGFTLEQRGFYFECLRRMWERKGGLVDEVKWLAAAISCDPRTVRRLRSFLINQGKLRSINGLLINSRAMRDIAKWKRQVEAKSGRRSGEDQPKLALIFPENPTESTVVTFPDGGILDSSSEPEGGRKKEQGNASLCDDEEAPPPPRRRKIPASIINALVVEVGEERADELIEEYMESGFEAGAKFIGPAFKGWLRKHHRIVLRISGGNTPTAAELLELCGKDEHGRPITALPKRVRR